MTIIILGLIVGVGTPVLVSGYQSFLLGTSIQRSDAVARVAMERISRELRNGLQATVTPLALNSASVQFTNSDGDLVTLTFQDNTLTVQHNAQSGVVAENIVGSFSITDESDGSNRFMPYRLIAVQLTVTQAIDQFEGQSVTVRSAVVPRNP